MQNALLRKIPYLLTILLLFACTRAPIKERTQALRPASKPFIADDLGVEDFISALESHVTFLEKAKLPAIWTFGSRQVDVPGYVRSLRNLLEWSKTQSGLEHSLWEKIGAEFEFWEVYGTSAWGKILLTSYFEPVIHGSLKPNPQHTQPLYKAPDDIIDVAISSYDERFSEIGAMKGRMAKDEKLGKQRLFPYYSREQIDGINQALKGRKLELCWVDPIDAFFMQIQGSGTVLFENASSWRLGYADQNGHKYHSIGKFLLDSIPLEKMTQFRIESQLRSMPPSQSTAILFRNPSYVFFRRLETAAITSLGNPVFNGRTIATDTRFFPKGALAFLQFQRPVFTHMEGDEVEQWQPVSRFVFDQDTGGAIRGPGRADLFWGTGDQAKRFAGVVKDENAVLYYLLPKAAVGEGLNSAPTQPLQKDPAKDS